MGKLRRISLILALAAIGSSGLVLPTPAHAGGGGGCTITTTEGDDYIALPPIPGVPTTLVPTVCTLGGDDTVIVDGTYRVFLGDGDDTAIGRTNVLTIGAVGQATELPEFVYGEEGDDTAIPYDFGRPRAAFMFDGGTGNDQFRADLSPSVSFDYVTGRAGEDFIDLGDSPEVPDGWDGWTWQFATGYPDYAHGGDEDDVIIGGPGPDQVIGGFGDDYIDLGDGDDSGLGGSNNDTVIGGAGADVVQGGSDNDCLDAVDGAFSDVVFGGWETGPQDNAGSDRAHWDHNQKASDDVNDVWDFPLRLEWCSAELRIELDPRLR